MCASVNNWARSSTKTTRGRRSTACMENTSGARWRQQSLISWAFFAFFFKIFIVYLWYIGRLMVALVDPTPLTTICNFYVHHHQINRYGGPTHYVQWVGLRIYIDPLTFVFSGLSIMCGLITGSKCFFLILILIT